MNRSIYSYRVLSVAVGVIAALAGNVILGGICKLHANCVAGPGSSNGTSISVSGIGNSITQRVGSKRVS